MNDKTPLTQLPQSPPHRFQQKLLKTLFPHYRGRWEAYDDILLGALDEKKVWLDVGCGRNEHVARFGSRAGQAVGVDRVDSPSRLAGAFVQADIRNLPFPASSVDLVTLRMVVEHLPEPEADLSDIGRVLKPGGKVIILTTNSRSPIVMFPRLLPMGFKMRLIRKLFSVHEEDVFPTYHRFNSAARLRRGAAGLRLTDIVFLEQVSPMAAPAFATFFFWYCLTYLPFFRYLRSNILAVLEKPIVEQRVSRLCQEK